MNAEAEAFWKFGIFKVKHPFIKLDFCSGINLIMVQSFCFEYYC
jgi:hypothetical protein